MEKWESRVKQETEIDSNGQVAECRRMVSDYCEKYLPVPLYNAAGSALSIAGSSPALTTKILVLIDKAFDSNIEKLTKKRNLVSFEGVN